MSIEIKVTNEDIYHEIQALRSDIVELKEFNAAQKVRNYISSWTGRLALGGVIAFAVKAILGAAPK